MHPAPCHSSSVSAQMCTATERIMQFHDILFPFTAAPSISTQLLLIPLAVLSWSLAVLPGSHAAVPHATTGSGASMSSWGLKTNTTSMDIDTVPLVPSNQSLAVGLVMQQSAVDSASTFALSKAYTRGWLASSQGPRTSSRWQQAGNLQLGEMEGKCITSKHALPLKFCIFMSDVALDFIKSNAIDDV